MNTKSIKIGALLVLTALLAFTGTALAAEAATGADGSWLDMLKPLYDAMAGGHYAYAAALTIIVMVALVKRYLGDKWTWLHSDAGGSAMALTAAAATAAATSLAAPGATMTLDLMKSALLVGVGAAGGYAVLKNLIVEPLLIPLQAKAPAWAKPILQLVIWIFDKPDAIKIAEAAGSAAVAAQPAQGATASTGAPTDVK
jgi:hypothetical protein